MSSAGNVDKTLPFGDQTEIGCFGVFRPGHIDIKSDKMLRVHGYKDPEQIREDVRQAARERCQEAARLLNVEVHFRRTLISRQTPGVLELQDGTRFESEIFGKYLTECTEVVAFILTTGQALDEVVRGYIDSFDLIEALFLESAGWIAIESGTRLFGAHLRRLLAREGKRPSMRLGPGYLYKVEGRAVTWPLEQQRELFHLFKGWDMPVKILESCAMTPKLSRSGLYGVAVARARNEEGANESS